MEALPTFNSLTLAPYGSNVKIFEHTLAIDVPDRLDSIAESFLQFNNESMSAINQNISDNMEMIHTYVGTTIVDDLNTFKLNLSNNIQTLNNNMMTNIGQYLDSNGAGYSIEQVNSLIFSGNTSYVLDANGNITSMVDGAMTTSNVLYNSDGFIESYTETILIGGVSYSKDFTVNYDGEYPEIQEALSA